MNKKIVWTLQIIVAAILLPVGIAKFIHSPGAVYVFTELGMEPAGRYIIGICEVLSGLLVLTEAFAAMGAFLGIGVMIGALIAHTTVLGFSVQGDGGKHIPPLLLVLISCCIITWIRRKQLPFIGKTF